MAKSKEQIMAELDARRIGYKSEMTAAELQKVLDAQAQKAVPAREPKPVAVGVTTIQDHEERITKLENALEAIKNG